MHECRLSYIPSRLHYTANKGVLTSFSIADILYRRVEKEEKENPYKAVSLRDLSHNIGTNNGGEVSKMKDVLYSVIESEEIERYNKEAIALEIKELSGRKTYDKLFSDPLNEDIKVKIILTHDPIPCMYPHCVFQFFVFDEDGNEIEVTESNYGTTLGHKRRYKRIRNFLRVELATMIVRKEITNENYD